MSDDTDTFPRLPALPLARAVERFLDPVQTREEACKAYGITGKTLSEWLTGRRPTAKFNTADRVLCHIELNWWEVWTPENTDPDDFDRVEEAFIGPDVAQLTERIRDLEDELERLQTEVQRAKVEVVPLDRMDAIRRAVELRTLNPTVFSWPTISTVMSIYHGFDRSATWWQRQLVSCGRVPRACVGVHERMAVA